MSEKRPIIYMVDDEQHNLLLLQHSLKSYGYELSAFQNGQELLDAVKRDGTPDMVLSDVMMPKVSGYEVCRALKSNEETANIPIVLITGLNDIRDKVKGLESGADDFLHKPFHPLELRARVRSLLRIKFLNDRLEEQNMLLEDEKLHLESAVRERTAELEDLTFGLVAALEQANKLNDADTGNHIKRVCLYSELLGQGVGLNLDLCNRIGRFASLHDVGKVGIPDSILKKPGKLTPEEWDEMKKHTVYGYDLLKEARADQIAQNIALCHHEKFDGNGYPYGLKGESIPIEARIVALADVFDALTNKRCYKEAFSNETAKEIILESSGSHFDPNVVRVMFDRMDDVEEIQRTHQNQDLPVVAETSMKVPPEHLVSA
ncbi:MAG TPA: response regulator [Myxococcales bacterium]|nr:response regulator [Myxococcales bacterium]